MSFVPPTDPAYVPGEAGQFQRDMLARGVGDALFPNLLYRAGVFRKPFPGTVGTSMLEPVAGLMKPVTKPIRPGVTPPPSSAPPLEYYRVAPGIYRDQTPVSMPANYASAVGPYWEVKHKQVLAAAQSLNRVCRNSRFRTAQYGHAIVDSTAGGGVTVFVSSLNGFAITTDPITGYPVLVSSASPRKIKRNGTLLAQTVIGATPLVADEFDGPGFLTMSAGTPIVAGDIVSTEDASQIVRPNGGASVDAIGPNDGLTPDLIHRAATILRLNNVQPVNPNGYYCHLDPGGTLDLSRTNQMQRQIETRGLADENYLRFAYGAFGACVFFENNESPREGTLDDGRIFAGRPNDAPAARTSAEIGAEIVNKNGVKISRAIVFGAEQIVESYVDENMYMTEAGLLGRVEARAAQNMGVEIYADGIRFIDRAPTDIFNEIATMAWSWTGDFVAPTNRLSSANGSSYPRAVVIEYAQTAF